MIIDDQVSRPTRVPRALGTVHRHRGVLTVLLVALAVLVHVPALRAPFFMDDYNQRGILEGIYPNSSRGPWDLFNFMDDANRAGLLKQGILPWWAHPRMVVHFFRPFPSLLVWLDFHLFGANALLDHVHSLLWWAAASLAVYLLLRKTFTDRVAWMGAACFAMAPCHVLPLVWLANRSALVSVTFGTLALAAYARWREGRRPGHGLASLALFTVAMLAGEYSLAFAGYVLAIEVSTRHESIARRVIGVAVFALPALAYLAAFAGLHCGAHGTGLYRDPIHDFRVFATAAPRSLAILLGLAWAGIDEAAWVKSPNWELALLVLGLALTLAVPVTRTLRALDETHRRRALWMLLGSMFALAPLLAVEPSVRLIGAAVVGVSAITALVIDHAWFPEAPPPRRGAAELTSLVALGLGFVHFVRAPLDTWIGAASVASTMRAFDDRVDWVREHAAEKSLVVNLRANASQTVLFVPLMLGKHPPDFRTLSYESSHLLLLRIGARSLELATGAQLFPEGPEDMFRDLEFPFHAGDEVELEGMRATVLLTRSDGAPLRVRYDFDRDLDEPSILWMVEGNSGFWEEKPPRVGFGKPIDR